MLISYHQCRPSAWTFTIKPVKQLLDKYKVGINWADPFAGKTSLAQYTNDINTDMPTMYHVDAQYFYQYIPDNLDGILFDPPYSYRQISEHYQSVGLKVTQLDTSYNFYLRVMKSLNTKIRVGGIVISFGWNSNGFPKNLGYEKIELMVLAHGMHHNDTLCLVQRKI